MDAAGENHACGKKNSSRDLTCQQHIPNATCLGLPVRTAEWHGRPGWWLPRGVDRQSYASLMELMGTSPACPSFKNRTCLHPDFSGLCQGSNSCNELILQGDAIARDEDENPRSSSNRISFRRSMLNRAAESTPGSPYKSGTGPKA